MDAKIVPITLIIVFVLLAALSAVDAVNSVNQSVADVSIDSANVQSSNFITDYINEKIGKSPANTFIEKIVVPKIVKDMGYEYKEPKKVNNTTKKKTKVLPFFNYNPRVAKLLYNKTYEYEEDYFDDLKKYYKAKKAEKELNKTIKREYPDNTYFRDFYEEELTKNIIKNNPTKIKPKITPEPKIEEEVSPQQVIDKPKDLFQIHKDFNTKYPLRQYYYGSCKSYSRT